MLGTSQPFSVPPFHRLCTQAARVRLQAWAAGRLPGRSPCPVGGAWPGPPCRKALAPPDQEHRHRGDQGGRSVIPRSWLRGSGVGPGPHLPRKPGRALLHTRAGTGLPRDRGARRLAYGAVGVGGWTGVPGRWRAPGDGVPREMGCSGRWGAPGGGVPRDWHARELANPGTGML